MDRQTIIDALENPDGFEREVSRRDAVRGGGSLVGAGLALAAMPLALAGFARRAFAQSALPNQIVNALNIAYILEALEAQFYIEGLARPGLIPAEDRTIFNQISKHETAHFQFLAGVLGANKAQLPRFDFTAGGRFDTFTNYETFKTLAQGFEDFGVRAYKGQAPNLMANDAILTAALRIHSVEARHASEVRRLRGKKGWIPGNGDDSPELQGTGIYAGEGNLIQLGINVGMYEGAVAGTEAFDEPVTSTVQVLTVIQPFIMR
jgi:hypothetical protein